MKVEFDSLKHEYKINGVIVPGVTSILGQDPEVFKMAARKKGLPDNYYADRGTAIHTMIYMYEMSKTPLEEMLPLIPYIGHLQAWIKFKSENKIEILTMEMIVVSEILMLAGTLDVLCILNGNKWILDIKSGGYSPSHEIQVSGYKKLYEDDPRIEDQPPGKIGGIYLRANGNYSFKEFKYNPYEVIRLRKEYKNVRKNNETNN